METIINTILNIMKKASISFFVCVMFICLIGSVIGDELIPISTLFQEGSIAYSTLIEIFSLSILVGMINAIFDHPNCMKKTLLLYKIILRMICVVTCTIFFIYVFAWFPFSSWEAWLGFIITFGTCFGLALSISIYTTRKKNQEYQKLLENYKKRGQLHGRNSHGTHS